MCFLLIRVSLPACVVEFARFIRLQGMEFEQTVGSDFASHLKYNSFISVGRSCDTSCRNKSRLTRNRFLEMSEVTVDYREGIIAKIGEYDQ